MFNLFSLDCDLIKYGTSFIVPLTYLLGISHEKHHWRIRLLYFHLLADYRKFCNSTSIFFHGYLSLYLPFTRGFSINIPSDSYSKYMIFLQEFRIRILIGKADNISCHQIKKLYWVYPLKYFLRESGCFIFIYWQFNFNLFSLPHFAKFAL